MTRPLVLEIHKKDYGWREGPFFFWYLKHSNGRDICRSYGDFSSLDRCEDNFTAMEEALSAASPTRKMKVLKVKDRTR